MKTIYKKLGNALYVLLLPLIRFVIKRTSRVHVAIIYNKEILLVKSWLARDTWRLPGGGIRRNESAEHAVIREIKEELGIILDPQNLVRHGEGTMKTDQLGYKYVSFVYNFDTAPPAIHPSLEITEHGFFSSMPVDAQDSLNETVKHLRDDKLL